MIRVFCPVPGGEDVASKLAPRVSSLNGVRVGLLGNLKPNADVLLHTTGELMVQLGMAGSLFREKSSCSLGAPEAMLDEIAGGCQAAVVALGD